MKKEIKITIKNRFTGLALFKFSKENNTIKETVIEANLSRADLSGADLYGANLSGADLYGANLSRADLYGANLSRADLSRADLSGANLSGADLSRADLSGANLSRADLSGANLSGVKIKKTAVFTGLYRYIAMPIISEDDKYYIRLGCYTRLISEWEEDFWNNNNDFPNNGSLDSEYRKMAFEFCKKWIELNK